ncbi:MAG: class I SAM-dependent methyltransferase [Chloroflexi bacterium]|nr:class I SAM-dependent methyltransferase [Chloroflexota bacterium]
MPVDVSPEPAVRRAALAGRLLEATLGSMDLAAVYLGDRLGLYRALAASGPLTSVELAAATDTVERYVREWLEQQAVTGILQADRESDALRRRYSLPAGHDEVLLDASSLDYLAPMARLLIGAHARLPELVDVVRTGGGLGWGVYGSDIREGQAAGNRPAFAALLGREWFPAMPDIDARLRADPPARVADIACGAGWSSIAIARAYPRVRVDGIDLDEPSIAAAGLNLRASELGDRVTFAVQDAADPVLAGRYDLVTIFEAVHDLARPVEVLAAARSLLAPGGAMIVMDERVAEEFTAPGDDVERLMYGFSILLCLTNSMAEDPSVATGTVMRPAALRAYAQAAGFADVAILPVEHPTWRFYRLV